MSFLDKFRSKGLDVIEDIIGNDFNDSAELGDYEWYCDECNALLNIQPGFDPDCGSWECTECGWYNDIDESEILDDEEIEDYRNSGCSSMNEYRYGSYNDYDDEEDEDDYDDDDDEYDDEDDSESLSVWDAAEIWLSKGMDEDYMFGYTEEELRDALN